MKYMHHKIASYLRKHKRPLYQKLVICLLSKRKQTIKKKIQIKLKRKQKTNS